MFHNVIYCVRHAQNVLLSVNVERSDGFFSQHCCACSLQAKHYIPHVLLVKKINCIINSSIQPLFILLYMHAKQ